MTANVQPALNMPDAAPAKTRKARTPKAAPVTVTPEAAPTTRKPRKASDPVARVHRAIMRDYLDKAAQALLYGNPTQADAWYKEARQRRAQLDNLKH